MNFFRMYAGDSGPLEGRERSYLFVTIRIDVVGPTDATNYSNSWTKERFISTGAANDREVQ